MPPSVDVLAEELLQETISRSHYQDNEMLREDSFTEVMIDYLVDLGELEGGAVCPCKGKGYKVNGSYLPDEEDRMDLFVTEAFLDGKINSLSKSACEDAFAKAKSFLEKSIDGLYKKHVEPASDEFDLAHAIYQVKDELVRVRFFLFTDGTTKVDHIPNDTLGDIEISYHVWDLTRLSQTLESGRSPERIIIDFPAECKTSIPCIVADNISVNYRTAVAIIPAEALVSIYTKFGPRLLERNIRSFLQAKGSVNKNIRKTLLDEPDMFLAYNNGLSITCSEFTTAKDLTTGSVVLNTVNDLQIVNGGQTTGSLFSAFRKDKAPLKNVLVPVKITEISGQEKTEAIAPKISLYANSQNKISMADFSANHPFHIKLQELSRTIFAPAPDGVQKRTKWFYERARGQYLDDKIREQTPSKQKAFEATNPPKQKFTKTDMAKYENTWDQLPHMVSRGAQKNFIDFMQRLEKRGAFVPEERYFQHLVAKAILFKSCERLVRKAFPAYRAGLVTYTIAWLSHRTAQKIDLNKIWAQQGLGADLEEAIDNIAHGLFQPLQKAPGGANITEWHKKESCWTTIKEVQITLPDSFASLIATNTPVSSVGSDQKTGIAQLSETEEKLINNMFEVKAETWLMISKWAKDTNNLAGWQRSISYSLGQNKQRDKKPSIKQAKQGEIILNEAKRLGFKETA